MDSTGSVQGRASSSTTESEKSPAVDKDMNQHDEQAVQDYTESSVTSKLEENMSNTQIDEGRAIGANAVFFKLGAMKTLNEGVLSIEEAANDKDCLALNDTPSHLLTEDKATATSNSVQPDTNLVAEVQEEVTKLNISGEEQRSEQGPSNVVVNKESESLRNLMAYDSASDSEVEAPCAVIKPTSDKTWRKRHQDDSSGTSDSESDSSTSTLSSESESDSDNSDGDEFNDDSVSVVDASDDGISPVLNKERDKGAVKKTNTSTVLDFGEYLPPIPDLSNLNINAAEEFMHIGRVNAIIAEIVTVEAIPGTPAFDLDSMLFIDHQSNKKPLGPIFDVLGPVSEPFYCVRFNSEDEIKKLGVKSGLKVYAAPKSDEFSKFLFVKELLRVKGTDASWLNDQEQPVDMAEFSDDEQERQARRGKANAKRKLDDSSLERHKRYEKTMNQCNTLNTRVCRLMDAQKNLTRQIRPNSKDTLANGEPLPPGLDLPDVPAEFDPTIPPPGFGHPSPYSYPAQGALFASAASVLGQPSSDGTAPSYGAHAAFSGPAQFGCFYANQTPAAPTLGASPVRWQRCDNFRRGRHYQRASHRQNSDNYFTNNGRNLRGAGPSYQPF